MNHKTLTQLRDDDFADCLRAVAGRYEKDRRAVSAETIIAEAMATSPKRYYVAFATIVQNVSRLLRSGYAADDPKLTSLNARQQWLDIYRSVRRYMILHKDASLDDAITYVVNYTRPARFYISDKKARELFRRTLRCVYHYVA